MQSLDLYAKIEPMIGFYEAYEDLYDVYEDIIKDLPVKTMLDVGCGNGNFLTRFKNLDAKGIDISPKMIKIAQKKGLNVSCKKIEDIDEKFDLITAVADVLNYLDDKSLKSFLQAVKNSLNPGGYFIFDINTLYGFSEVAEGVMIQEDQEKFLAIEAEFLDKKLITNFTLFEQNKECYKKFQWQIKQYFHEIAKIKKLSFLKQKIQKDLYLFSEEAPDKTLFVLNS